MTARALLLAPVAVVLAACSSTSESSTCGGFSDVLAWSVETTARYDGAFTVAGANAGPAAIHDSGSVAGPLDVRTAFIAPNGHHYVQWTGPVAGHALAVDTVSDTVHAHVTVAHHDSTGVGADQATYNGGLVLDRELCRAIVYVTYAGTMTVAVDGGAGTSAPHRFGGVLSPAFDATATEVGAGWTSGTLDVDAYPMDGTAGSTTVHGGAYEFNDGVFNAGTSAVPGPKATILVTIHPTVMPAAPRARLRVPDGLARHLPD
ncbi:MAG TPA: hypothetical protein VFS07_09750 [Gemmatimonadales bacterium]|nr:hypothetical protein [Gemmatimonadales bacterium]